MRNQIESPAELIALHVAVDGDFPEDARIRQGGMHVWAVVGYYKVVNDIEQVAREYEISGDAVRAALAYYAMPANRAAIDAKLASNVAA